MRCKSTFQFFSIKTGSFDGNPWAQVTLVDEDHKIWELSVPKDIVPIFVPACAKIGYLDMVEAELSVNPYKGKEGKTMYSVRLEGMSLC